jgi:predicted dehydrogenase
MKKKISVGIIGFGRMGQNHAKVINNIKSCKLKFILEKKIKDIDQNFNGVKIYNKEKDFFNNKIDLLIISTTTDTHFYFVKIAIKNKIKKIFLEKPMANSFNNCLKIIDLAKKNKTSIRINHQMEYMPAYKDMSKIINSKNLGGLVSMSVNGGNFGLAMNGSHYIYAFLMLTRDKIEEIFCKLENKILKNPRGKKFQDNSGILIAKTFKNKFLIINTLANQHHGMSVTYNCKYGIIFINEFNGRVVINYRKSKYRNFPSVRYGLPEINKQVKLKFSLSLTKTTKYGILDLLKDNYLNNLNISKDVVEALMLAQKSNLAKTLVSSGIVSKFNSKIFKWA